MIETALEAERDDGIGLGQECGGFVNALIFLARGTVDEGSLLEARDDCD